MQLPSGVRSSNSSVGTAQHLAFQTGTGSSWFRVQPTSTIEKISIQRNAGVGAFCPVPAATSAPNSSKKTLPEKIFQVMQNLLPWRQHSGLEDKAVADSISIVSTHQGEGIGEKPSSEGRRLKRGFWRYSQMLKSQAVESSSSTNGEQFQVRMRGQVIAQFPTKQQAERMAHQLKQFFCQPLDSYRHESSVEPAFSHGQPAVKVGTRLFLKVDDKLANNLGKNRQLLAIKWANNLRVALGQGALTLTEAQERMHNLVETSSTIEGIASWYGPYFHGRVTATGETYNENELTAAHPSLPFDTYLKVRNLENGNSVIVRINDRGPYIPGRTLDLSRQAARSIKSEKAGIIPFEAIIMQPSSAR
ncbi:septal ring lytic transglycosylase RlpA family protein [Coleofasciculus sp. LEGE 07092]|nr:septal ring lytic transglycosylase RlpA family protein [Coleofasciculus sp. LEGE 07081]MBE9148094.1 septal ring lytic transglycosylase RlpA family protein [Coleofasciculus sp. LEGE 07092]